MGHEIPALERLAKAVPIEDLVIDPSRKGAKPVGTFGGTLAVASEKR
jgi:hypothetical protein